MGDCDNCGWVWALEEEAELGRLRGQLAALDAEEAALQAAVREEAAAAAAAETRGLELERKGRLDTLVKAEALKLLTQWTLSNPGVVGGTGGPLCSPTVAEWLGRVRGALAVEEKAAKVEEEATVAALVHDHQRLLEAQQGRLAQLKAESAALLARLKELRAPL